MMSARAIGAEGAPSLRFLQGRVTMLPTQLLSLCNPVTHAFQIPALCKVRKGRGTHCVFGASEVKSLGHPPSNRLCRLPTVTSLLQFLLYLADLRSPFYRNVTGVIDITALRVFH